MNANPTLRKTKLTSSIDSISKYFMHKNPDSSVPDPDSDPYPDMTDFTVKEEGVRKLLQKSKPHKTSGPDLIPEQVIEGM